MIYYYQMKRLEVFLMAGRRLGNLAGLISLIKLVQFQPLLPKELAKKQSQVAQLVEQMVVNHCVMGSSPSCHKLNKNLLKN